MIIWNWHNDEYERLHYFTGGHNFIGDFPPLSDVIAMPDGWWLEKISDKSKVIIYPCVKDTSHISAMGFKYAFTKDTKQGWNGEAVVLPPVFKTVQQQKKTDAACSVIHYYAQREPKNFQKIAPLGYPIYGFGHEVNYDIDGTLAKTKFLIHQKEIGYLCNAVIKAMNHGCIPIMNSATYTYGYEDYLTPNETCIIADSTEQILEAIHMSEQSREQMQHNLYNAVENIKDTYHEASIKAHELIQRVING